MSHGIQAKFSGNYKKPDIYRFDDWTKYIDSGGADHIVDLSAQYVNVKFCT